MINKKIHKIKASIDIGSNSVLLLAGNFSDRINRPPLFHQLLNLCEVTGLGKGIDQTGNFQSQSMQATMEVLRQFKQQLHQLKISVDETLITATEASRVAKNAPAFYRQIKDELGFEVKIITAEGEAYYSALGVSLGVPSDVIDQQENAHEKQLIVMDIGGASTELIAMELNPFAIKRFISLPIGSVRATEWKERGSIEGKISSILQQEPFKSELSHFKTKNLISIAGTMTSLAYMSLEKKSSHFFDHYRDEDVHGVILPWYKLKKMNEVLKNKPLPQLMNEFPFLGKRAATISAGSEVATILGTCLEVEQYIISVYGARYATLYQGKIKDEFLYHRQGA